MKVLFLCDFGSAHGGAEIATLSLRDGLRERGHEALLFSSSARPSDLPILADAICHGSLGFSQIYLQTANPSAWWNLREVMRDFQPDVVHVSMLLLELSPLILPLLKGIPAVYHAHWMRSVCPTGTKLLPDRSLCQNPAGSVCYRSGCLTLHDWSLHMAQRALWRRWRGVFQRVVTPSQALRSALMSDGFENILVIPNGVPQKPARPALSGSPTVLFCGRLVKEKGIDILLKAWTGVVDRLPEARLLVAGDGPDRPILEPIERRNVRFLGHVAHGELDAIAADCWVQAVPSVCIENSPLVLLEAMMRGSAVVASAVGGIPEIVDDGVTGLLTLRGDVEALRDALLALLSDRALCEAMGVRGRFRVQQRFSREAYVTSFEELYRSLARSQPRTNGRGVEPRI